ncbi:MAG: GTPase Era [Christensenellaceae bacterium]|jgi:GTP-binding protein Era
MQFHSGFVSILGSPNVGKSTLMNALVGQKVAIATKRAQTTRNKVTGILTREGYQIIFLDTPGIHTPKNKLGEYMVHTAYDANRDVDLTLFVIDGEVGLGPRDIEILARLSKENLLVLLNKIDAIAPEKQESITARIHGEGVAQKNILPISALTGKGLIKLEERILSYLPEGPLYYPADMITDRPERFIAAELIREKALEFLREEVPHGVGVEIEKIEEFEDLTEVSAILYCEQDSHKGIIIGKGGAMLKKIGSAARMDLEMLFGTQVYLELFVKVKKDWRNSNFMLKELGYRKE